MSKSEDAVLVIGCKKKDRNAMEMLYRKYTPRMLAVSMRYCSRPTEAQDIVQDAFIKVFNSIPKYQHQGFLKSWIERIVINTAIDHYKKSKKIISLDHTYEPQAEEAIPKEGTFINGIEIGKIRTLIAELPEQYRYVLNLYAVEGYSHKEIGEMLGIKESTSRSNYTRARKKLIKAIGKIKETV